MAGGGIGGLAVALGLALKGRATVVLEKAPELGEIGPNAFHCVDALGVGDQAPHPVAGKPVSRDQVRKGYPRGSATRCFAA